MWRKCAGTSKQKVSVRPFCKGSWMPNQRVLHLILGGKGGTNLKQVSDNFEKITGQMDCSEERLSNEKAGTAN